MTDTTKTTATTGDARPLWLRVIQFPLTRLVVLGSVLLLMMAMTEGYLKPLTATPLVAGAVALGMGILAIALYAAYGKFVERRAVTELSLPGMGREWATGAAIGAGLYTSCALILMLLGIYRIEGMNPVTFLIPALAMSLKSGIFEELVFRGVLLRSVEQMFGSWVALAVSSLAFGFLHLLNPGATLMGAVYISIEAGLLLGAAYLATRRLWLSIGFHMAWNYVQSAVFSGTVSGAVTDPGLIRDSIQGPDLLTGGSFGMEQSVFALVLCTTAGVVLLRIAHRRGHILPRPW